MSSAKAGDVTAGSARVLRFWPLCSSGLGHLRLSHVSFRLSLLRGFFILEVVVLDSSLLYRVFLRVVCCAVYIALVGLFVIVYVCLLG